MIRCDQVREQMLAHLEARLSEGAAADFDRHLEGCEACRRAWAEERMLAGALAVAQGLAGDDLVAGVMGRVQTLAGQPRATDRMVRLHPSSRPLLALLAAAAAIVVWLWLGTGADALAAVRATSDLLVEGAVVQLADLGALLGSLVELAHQVFHASLTLPAGLEPVAATPWDYLATAVAGLSCSVAIARFRTTASEENRP